ncbi:10386_t:CDS:10, partial [Funneliformis caledonium]
MFKKPSSNIKNFSLLRSSDRRRFKEEILKKFPSLESSLHTLTESTTDITESPINSFFVPEHIQSAKFVSNAGTHGVIYITNEKQPIWFRIDKDKKDILVPCVYTLWKFPDMLPKIPTFTPVISKLTGGANLMIPGIAFPSEGLPEVNEGELVSIVIRDLNIPMAVGTMNISTKLLKPGSTRKGVAVIIFHVFGDYLWSMGDRSSPPELSDVELCQEAVEADTSESKVAEISEVMVENDESLHKELSISEVDSLLEASFYQALLEKLTPTTPLPMATSQFYSAYILPCRPVGTDNEVDIKKSSYKKVSKFLKAMEKKGVIKIKESNQDLILNHVNWKHENLDAFRPHKTIESAINEVETQASSSVLGSMQIQVKEVFKPKGAIIDLFKAQGQNIVEDTTYEYKEIKTIISNYLKSHNLSDKQNRRLVIPDEQIREALVTKSGERIPEKWTRDDLVQQIQLKMEPCHYVIFPDHDPELRKGSPKRIQISELKRVGNKVVTTICGLEAYRINPNDLIEPLKKLCASSVAVNPTLQSSPKKPLMEVMIQGPQTKQVKNYLINTKGCPEKYIEIKL